MKVHKKAEKLDKIIFKLMYFISMLSGICLLLVAVLCTIDSLLSKFLSVSIPSGTDWVTYLNIPVVFLSMGYIQIERGNTVVDILSSKFPKKMDKIVKVCAYFLSVLLCAYLGKCGFSIMIDKINKHAMSSGQMSAFSVWPFAMIIAVGYTLAAIAFLWCIIREFLIPPEKRAGAVIQEGQDVDNSAQKGPMVENGTTKELHQKGGE